MIKIGEMRRTIAVSKRTREDKFVFSRQTVTDKIVSFLKHVFGFIV